MLCNNTSNNKYANLIKQVFYFEFSVSLKCVIIIICQTATEIQITTA